MHGPAARIEAIRELGQQPLQRPEFVVDRDPQRLKGAGGRIDRVAASRHTAAHEVRKLTGRGYRLALSGLDDPPGNPPTEPFLAELVNQVGEVALGQPPQQIGGRLAPGRVHPHIEKGVMLEAESARLGSSS